jgi:predicted alternative tryptophan synthase beta-subunit
VQVTEVWIGPDNRYCFEVVVGGRNVAAFSFEDLGSATAAAGAMRRLAPAVSTVLLQMRTGEYKRDVPEFAGRRFW